MKTFRVEVVCGYSAHDHLAPIGIDGEYRTISAARSALEKGRRLQGACETKCRKVRCDIVRSDGERFEWE